MRSEVLTKEQFPPLAMVAVSTKLRVICSHLVTNAYILHGIADCHDDSGRFMSRDDGHGGGKISIVDVQVCAADTAGLDYSYVTSDSGQ